MKGNYMQGLTQQHAAWLEDIRKIPCELAAETGVESSGTALAFQFRQNGQLRFTKFRSADKRFWIEPSGAVLQFWNEDALCDPSLPEAPRIITEGEFDALAFLMAGATHVGSVPNGAAGKPGEGDIVPTEDRQFQYLWDGSRLKPGLANAKKIILATDGDTPGLILRDELAIRLGRHKCWFVTYPEGCKDANEVLIKHGADAVMDLIADAKPLVPNKLVKFSEIPNPGEAPRYSSGWRDMDKHLMICPPELMVVTGTPGAGKSQWTLALCCNLARLHGLKGTILQFEDKPYRNKRDLLRYAEAWANQEKGGIAERPAAWVDRMFRTISPDESADGDTDFDLKWVRSAIEEAATRHNNKWILIDPWNEVEHVWKVNETETAYTNQALRDLKKLSRQFQVAIIIVTHPSKSSGMTKTVDDFTLYDISGSQAWANKADHGIIVHRADKQSVETFVKIDKCKDYETMGRPGTVKMKFDFEHATFNYVGPGK
jgi:twinkle protein